MMHDPLWRDTDVIHVYTRAQALTNGALIDLSPLAAEAGFRYPVAVTAAVWQILEPSADLARLGQSATGRAWDVLQVLRAAIREDLTAQLVLPETFMSRTRRTVEVTHATLLRDPRSLTAQSFLVLVRDDEDPTMRFHRVCDGLMTTPLHLTWAPWLWQWATQSGAVHALQSIGCRAWQGCVDEAQLEQALRRALANELLCIPSVASSS
jgi:hypothetical protein